MGRAVVHFEIVGKDGAALRAYYRELFGWEADADNPFQYGLIDRESVTNSQGVGIGGGIGGMPEGYEGHVTVYVEVPDVAEALARAEALGGSRVMEPETLMPGVTIAQFKDVSGNLVGLLEGMG